MTVARSTCSASGTCGTAACGGLPASGRRPGRAPRGVTRDLAMCRKVWVRILGGGTRSIRPICHGRIVLGMSPAQLRVLLRTQREHGCQAWPREAPRAAAAARAPAAPAGAAPSRTGPSRGSWRSQQPAACSPTGPPPGAELTPDRAAGGVATLSSGDISVEETVGSAIHVLSKLQLLLSLHEGVLETQKLQCTTWSSPLCNCIAATGGYA